MGTARSLPGLLCGQPSTYHYVQHHHWCLWPRCWCGRHIAGRVGAASRDPFVVVASRSSLHHCRCTSLGWSRCLSTLGEYVTRCMVQEDKLLKELVDEHGPVKWAQIAAVCACPTFDSPALSFRRGVHELGQQGGCVTERGPCRAEHHRAARHRAPPQWQVLPPPLVQPALPRD